MSMKGSLQVVMDDVERYILTSCNYGVEIK